MATEPKHLVTSKSLGMVLPNRACPEHHTELTDDLDCGTGHRLEQWIVMSRGEVLFAGRKFQEDDVDSELDKKPVTGA